MLAASILIGALGWILFIATFFVGKEKSIKPLRPQTIINKLKSQKAIIVELSDVIDLDA